MNVPAIVAKNFRIEETKDSIEVKCDVSSDGFPEQLVIQVHPDNVPAIDIEEPNWAAVLLIYQAMLMGRDLVIEADLSPMLVDNMRGDLTALLKNYEPSLNAIEIETGLSSSPNYLNKSKDIATGFSAGVDSFTTCRLYTRPEVPPGVRLTGLAIFDFGALGPKDQIRDLMSPARKRCQTYADSLGLKTYSLSGNIDEIYAPAAKYGVADLPKTVGLRNAAGALLLQKEIGIYRPSPNVGYDQASYGPATNTEVLDAVMQPLLSTEGLQFRPGAAGMSRRSKIAYLADFPDAQKFLDVCVNPDQRERYQGARINCSKCWKCINTMATLEVLGKLDNFSTVFDLPYYHQNRRRLLQMVANMSLWPRYRNWIREHEELREMGLDVPRPELRKRVRKVLGNGKRALEKRLSSRCTF
ncbi:MAG: hypothetical protein OEY85_09650 [Rhodospirillales bacterium]|nr:hypothetical protein [Rhodospirillales bacterium]